VNHLPTGTVTYLFTDIEGSTKLLQRLGDRYTELLDEHGTILRAAIAAGRGIEVNTEGDAFFAVFRSATDAVTAATAAQRALAAHPWDEGNEVRVRMGLHSGEAVLGGAEGRCCSPTRPAPSCSRRSPRASPCATWEITG